MNFGREVSSQSSPEKKRKILLVAFEFVRWRLAVVEENYIDGVLITELHDCAPGSRVDRHSPNPVEGIQAAAKDYTCRVETFGAGRILRSQFWNPARFLRTRMENGKEQSAHHQDPAIHPYG